MGAARRDVGVEQPLKGRELQRAIIELARRLGWRVAHFPPVATERGWRTPVAADGKGFPDLILVRDRVVIAEVKGDSDRLRAEQRAWLDAFSLAGMSSYIWTPESWRKGEVEQCLRWRRGDKTPLTIPVVPGVLLGCGT